jgi:hypothetical protein
MAFTHMGRVPLGHHIVDPRTMQNRIVTNIAGMTGGLPMDSRKVFQAPIHHPSKVHGKAEQSLKAKLAGIVVDPTAIETFQGADPVSVDTTGGYGILPASSEDM